MKNNSLFIILYRMRVPFLVIIIAYTIAITGLVLIEGKDASGNPYHMSIFDAFYFISYTATTIGFGETPYEFTYSQRIWVSFSIYITVIGWFYGIGSLVRLLQDKLFLQEIEKSRFKRQIRRLKQKFIIILGYNQITSEIIKRALEQDIRTVVIEKSEERGNDLLLENFTPTVPLLIADAHSSVALEQAGIKKHNCKGLVSLFEDDSLNLRIALTSKLLNKNVKLAIKSTTENHTENLKDLDVEIVANPFLIISKEINMALNAPNLLKLEKWLFKVDTLNSSLPIFPKGKYIICGFGRMGQSVYERLKTNNIEAHFIEIKKKEVEFKKSKFTQLTYADADDKDTLLEIGIKDAVAIIAATNNDTTNLSILATAKKLNPNIMTIVRENEMEDFSIFKSANIDHIFMPAKILINKTTNALINPLSDIFIRLISEKEEIWAAKLVRRLFETINENPILFELELDFDFAPEIARYLKIKKELELKIFRVSLHNKELNNNVVPLLILRDEEQLLLPSWETKLELNDKILFACDEHAKNDMEYIAQNIYEFYYALTGKEKRTIFKGLFK
ncbi:potassium transporter TrkA [Malaciobacter halophilus]|uniref:Potassium transporter TrkA n=1 Tax=Malaciobacter halophilus TaxID=197482 RepID=A0A2N1J085_9BACT|nr:NAD-binding protein [Malaciobacter halophilus]AXH10281.1 TrkA domain-containing protein [Malaciobacter halophilus]PKI79967.1 potassium transporter TrkA [Malaciobacter halophilus]